MSTNFTHFLRIGIHSEAEFFQKARPLYDALILNANLVEATSSASAALVYRLGKPFLIDPFTHAFSLNPKYLMSKSKGKAKDIRLKRSFQGLSKRYFSDATFVGQRSLTESDISVDDFTASVLDYQSTVLTTPGAELVALMGADPEIFKPKWLIAPYFPLRRTLGWLDMNIALANSAIARHADSCVVIAIELGALRAGNAWESIADQYADTKPKAIFLWIESFDEDQAEEEDLRLYCDFVRRIDQRGIAVINLFGGFFSCLAQCAGLGGFAHGLVYGENKSFTPVVGGGQPPPRYYLKPAHISMNVRGAEVLLSGLAASSYLDDVCNCTICAGLFKKGEDLTRFAEFSEANDQGKFMPRAYALCRYHFLLARNDEIKKMYPLTPAERITAITKDEAFLRSINAEDSAEHLATWIRVIRALCA